MKFGLGVRGKAAWLGPRLTVPASVHEQASRFRVLLCGGLGLVTSAARKGGALMILTAQHIFVFTGGVHWSQYLLLFL